MFTESFITTSGVVIQKTAFYGSEYYIPLFLGISLITSIFPHDVST